MPRVSVWLVRASLLSLAVGATLGALLMAGKGGGWAIGAPLLRTHRELLLVGWLVQLALGVGFWILPPVRGSAIRKRPAWTVAAVLDTGLVLFVLGVFWNGSPTGDWLRTAGRSLEALAVVGFAIPLLGKPFR